MMFRTMKETAQWRKVEATVGRVEIYSFFPGSEYCAPLTTEKVIARRTKRSDFEPSWIVELDRFADGKATFIRSFETKKQALVYAKKLHHLISM